MIHFGLSTHFDHIRHVLKDTQHQTIHGIPAVERICVVAGEEGEFIACIGVVEDHRRGEIAEERGNRAGSDVYERPLILFILQFKDASCAERRGFPLKPQGNVVAFGVHETDRDRNDKGCFTGCPGVAGVLWLATTV